MEFKDILKQELDNKKILQSTFAEITEISNTTISSYISGKTLPNTRELIILADTLNVSLDYLTGRESKPQTHKQNGRWFKQRIFKMLIKYPIGTVLKRIEEFETYDIEIEGYRIRKDMQILETSNGNINYENMEKLTRRK